MSKVLRSYFRLIVFRHRSDITVVCPSSLFILDFFFSLSFFLVCMPEEGFKGKLHLSCFVHECQSPTVIFS